jgi:hypothetical protein
MEAPEPEPLRTRLGRLEREIRLWRWSGIAVVSVVALMAIVETTRSRAIAVASPNVPERGLDDDAPEAPGDPDVLYGQLRRMGERSIAMVDRSARQRAMIRNAPEEVARWASRLLEAEHYGIALDDGRRTADPELHLVLADGRRDQGRIDAFRDYLTRLEDWEARFRPLAVDGTISELRFLELQSRRILAEAWLSRELRKPEG